MASKTASLYIALIVPLLITYGCKNYTKSIVNYSVTPTDSMNKESPCQRAIITLELDDIDEYVVRQVNELMFLNETATDTIMSTLINIAPIGKDESLRLYILSDNRIMLEKLRRPRFIFKTFTGEEEWNNNHYGYVQIDTFFIDVVYSKSASVCDMQENARNIFKETSHTHEFEYKYRYPSVGGGLYFIYEITDSTVKLIDNGYSE